MTKQQMINILNDMFKGIAAVDASMFFDKPSDGIWIKHTETALINGLPIFDEDYFDDGINPELCAVVEANGWYCEPYDPGTMMIFR